jgi:1-deoxy-D-xylulose-5-phosphate synthase
MFDEIPDLRPLTPLLDTITCASDVRALEAKQLPLLAEELRAFLLYSVGKSGGHFGAGLGVVELTIALHYALNTPEDRLVWDVGHQTYPHKILTGRRDQIGSIRQLGGLSGFPRRSESPYDAFGVGHSSTSISAALGMAIGAQLTGQSCKTVAVIGDGAMTAGMAFEALNHAAYSKADLLVVLNDNSMSISPNVGGLANYFSKIWASKAYTSFREGGKKVLKRLPQASEIIRKTEEHMKGMVSPGTLFEELGFYYVGPIDGHDLPRLTHDLKNLSEVPGPKLLHVITQKGKGFGPAEKDPVGYHALNKIEPQPTLAVAKAPKYQDIFGRWLCDKAELDEKLVAITPAMCEGSGMVEFSQRFAQRYFDVAIAEQHAVTLAAGLACEGLKPVVAIYSTFLQRAYDQVIHDVAIQKLDVTFAIDRAGLVGEDGPTHSGNFDLSFLSCIPELIIAVPSDENDCYQLLNACYAYPGPAAIRYPRGTGPGTPVNRDSDPYSIGKSQPLLKGSTVCLFNFGVLLPAAKAVALRNNYTLIDMRWAKPLDHAAILQAAANHCLLVTLEENTVQGGAGSALCNLLNQRGIDIAVLNLGLPDCFIEHAKRSEQLSEIGLDFQGIEDSIKHRLIRLQTASLT